MKNYYAHTVDLRKIEIRNDNRENFTKKIEEIEYRGYEVEKLSDGRKIVITKPGGKSTYGRAKKEDFLVFIFHPKENGLWQISHKQILDDLYLKSEESSEKTLNLIKLLERTFNGEEPSDFINEITLLKFQVGETSEALIKVYKWIWGQEDVNYPNGEGRKMSWAGIEKLKNELS